MGDIFLITKRDEWCLRAGRLAQMIFGGECHWIKVGRDERIPDDFSLRNPRILISFLSPWIIPEYILDKCELAINFHPGSASYPGFGCYNFALYEEADTYGAVCHVMNEKVDTGSIIEQRTFPVLSNDTVETLKYRTMIVMTAMYLDVLSSIRVGKELKPQAGINWSRKPFTKKELNDLCVVTPDMTDEEIRKRVRATTYPGFPGASISLAGITFSSLVPDREPLA